MVNHETNIEKDDEHVKPPSRKNNKKHLVQSVNKYELQERKKKTLVAYSLRISSRNKKFVSYAESDDEKDSDYEPTSQRAHNTNVGL